MNITLLLTPTGKYVTVGFSIPSDLAYRHVDGRNLTTDEARKVHVAGPGFCTKFAKRVVWGSITAATDDIIGRYPDAVISA